MNNIDTLTLMSASNILGRGLGKKKLEIILEKYPDFVSYIPKDENKWRNKLLELPGFQETTVNKILENMPNYLKYQKLFAKKIKIKEFKSNIKKNGKYKDMNIVFTGFRNKNWEDFIKHEGGKLSSSVSKNTNLLVYEDSATNTEKFIKAKSLGVKTIPKSKFKI